MEINKEYIVKIEKMLNQGSALARIDNFPVFIENGCPDDTLKIKITKINKKYAIGAITEILTPSKSRIIPLCAMSSVCGSCNWQYISYEEQLKQKTNIVKETIKNITGQDYTVNDIISSEKISQYRCKVRYPVSKTKVSKRLLAGYYKKNSHELINIKFCPMQPQIINEITDYIRECAMKIEFSTYNEKNHSGLLRHIIFRTSSDLSNILIIFVLNSNEIPKEIIKLSKDLKNKFPQICGLCVNFNTQKTNVILGKTTKQIIGDDFYIENLNGYKYKISANSFFQVNPYTAIKIFDYVKSLIKERFNFPTILDAYSGVSSFGVWLSSVSSKIVCIEEVKNASENAIENANMNSLKNLEIINGDAEKIFADLIKNNTKFDVSLVDPPRKGCTPKSIKNLVKLSKNHIIYVSCSVSTLARDMNLLEDYGFFPEVIQPVDMFPNTYHVETIVLFKKK